MFILINKSKGITSHDVVNALRKITGEKKIGHAGTLDPFATGLLIVGIGRQSTKRLWEITEGNKKEYLAELVLGKETDTLDSTGKTQKINKVNKSPSEILIKKVLGSFIGQKKQIPPKYSAIKLAGKKSYELAREGKSPKLKPRDITVYSIKLINYKYPLLNFSCTVSGGTYIRSLARDIGRKLNTGGYLSKLQRTRIGKYSLKDAVSLSELDSNNWVNHTFEIKTK